jgi:hypothetical protein
MSEKISLKEVERKAYRTLYEDGLWDILLGCFTLMFAVAPLLSGSLGDFWSSMIFLPFWGLVFLAIWLLRRYVVRPRLGEVRLGRARQARLLKFNLTMLVLNLIALALGVYAAANFGAVHETLLPVVFALCLLFGFSLAAYFLELPRLFVYGLLIALCPLVGEWLYQTRGAAHHGYPITFGFVSALIILSGVVRFVRFLRANPLAGVDAELLEASDGRPTA